MVGDLGNAVRRPNSHQTENSSTSVASSCLGPGALEVGCTEYGYLLACSVDLRWYSSWVPSHCLTIAGPLLPPAKLTVFSSVAICMGSCRNSASLAARRGRISSSFWPPPLPLDFTVGMASSSCKPTPPCLRRVGMDKDKSTFLSFVEPLSIKSPFSESTPYFHLES